MKKSLLFLFAIGLLLGSCRRKEAQEEVKVGGCTDTNSPFYKAGLDFDDGSCKFAFVDSIEVVNFPEKNNGSSWDDFGGKADIYVRFKPVSSANYDDYFNSIGSDIGNAVFDQLNIWEVNTQFQLTNEDWYWELMDKDSFFGGSDDKIASGIMNPIQKFSTSNEWVMLTNDNGEVQIRVKTIIQ